MKIEHFPCDAFVNESEERAYRSVHKCISNIGVHNSAFIITNLAHSIGDAGQPDEIDMIILVGDGVVVIEVKHWDHEKIKKNLWDVEDAADLITKKTKRVAGRLRNAKGDLGYVSSAMIFTKESGSFAVNKQLQRIRGVRIASLRDIELLFPESGVPVMGNQEVERLARILVPRAAAMRSGDLKRIGRITELKRLTPEQDRFSRIYAGRDASSGDRVTVHLFDLSATGSANAERQARREFEVVQKLQKSPYLPKLVDSFQPVPNYPGELFFFTLADTSAPSLRTVAGDAKWKQSEGASFCAAALRALAELHVPSDAETTSIVHRCLNPDTIHVRHDGSPLFSGWRWARWPNAQTIVEPTNAYDESDLCAAPEVLQNGLSFADARSDVYSLCKSLFDMLNLTEGSASLLGALRQGLEPDPQQRANALSIAANIESLANGSADSQRAQSAALEPRRWDEGTPIEWEGGRYRVVSKLGEGATGRTYKLEQIDHISGISLGTFVGKVVADDNIGPIALNAFRKIRSIADHPSLSGVFHFASEWSPDRLLALLKWRKGEPLSTWSGELLPLLAEEVVGAGATAEELILTWAVKLCAALEVLHLHGWVHGDVSPSNIIVDGAQVCLIDFDLACAEGEIPHGSGTAPFVSLRRRNREPAQASDDIFALAASLFNTLTGRLPFLFEDGVRRDDAGLAWCNGEREAYPVLAVFLDRATAPEQGRRFQGGGEALTFLKESAADSSPLVTSPAKLTSQAVPAPLRPNEVPRVKEILSVYPGSRFGNAETRGLDTSFAANTFVRTGLDEKLLLGIQAGDISLVILCGNAGDGKTALLQHLAKELGSSELRSDRRVATFISGGRRIVINLDGAASWGGSSADVLMDDIFQPFHNGPPLENVVHLVAVNDGRLMEWAESYERRSGETRLTKQIAEALSVADTNLDNHISLVELNERSLVGGFDIADGGISTRFVDEMIMRLVGGDDAGEIWQPCRSCSAMARCSIRASAEMMGASSDANVLAAGTLLRSRLVEALQAVHQRDEVHITARELKAALSYILFGIHACEDLHADPNLSPHDPADFAFNPSAPLRQGDLLRELARLDPALEANSRVDRYLTGPGSPSPLHGAPRYPGLSLRKARRRAYLQWTDDQTEAVSGSIAGLGLAQGRHFAAFRKFPFLQDDDRRKLRDEVCRGLSRLETLPDAAFRESDVAPIRIVPRTPTETAFWVGKPFARFTLEAEQFPDHSGLETLHRHLVLTYRAPDGRIEQLTISLPLFALLRDLTDGVQLLDAFSDDVFANLNVFTQRLAQEDERMVFAWTPSDEDRVYTVNIERGDAGQVIVLDPTQQGA